MRALFNGLGLSDEKNL